LGAAVLGLASYGLGKAISYLLRHWTKLTLFHRQPGAPLDNNIVERSLKKAILHRKNALFYKTMNGAGVGADVLKQRAAECRYVLETLGKVYQTDAQARNGNYRQKADCCSISNTAGRCWMNCANGWTLSLRRTE
jgi:Transposase IS66 family